MKLLIQPNDVLFFRDGRPFDAGGDHVAKLSFPPSSLTFYGAIRAALIAQSGHNFADFKSGRITNELKETVGYIDGAKIAQLGNLRITDFGLANVETNPVTRLFPVPLDVAEGKDSGNYYILNPEKIRSDGALNFPHKDLHILSANTQELLETPSSFLTSDGLNSYLSHQKLTESHFVQPRDVFLPEYRVGIEKNTFTQTVETGQLYSIEFARFRQNTGFALELEGMNGNEAAFTQTHSPLLRLGGESRSAWYNVNTEWQQLKTIPVTNGRFKLVLLTHTVFENGWWPDGIDQQTLTGSVAGCPVKLIAAAVGRAVGIGGWDIVSNRSKPMRRAVPAGSVYYFECTAEPKASLLEPNGFLHIGEEQFTKQGLGQAIIGTWNYIGEQ